MTASGERCARCGHPEKRIVFGMEYNSHRGLGCIFKKPGPARYRCACPAFVPPASEGKAQGFDTSEVDV